MKEDYAHKSILHTSDFILTIVIVVGGLVEYFLLWHWSMPIPEYLRIILGITLLLFSISLIAKSKSELNKAKQPSEPGKPTTQIIQSGIYAQTRNPTYLGCAILLLGLGITFNFYSWVVGSLFALVLMHVLLVLPEEKYLSAKFPKEFSEYKKKVRRWI
ncbi:methyltransferase family protein [Flagellimonas sp.]|uniref:methyltransferase family protein n=1 Tax=Flagellimonas sp. TaxID=2058762 RepID=UPI003B59131D